MGATSPATAPQRSSDNVPWVRTKSKKEREGGRSTLGAPSPMAASSATMPPTRSSLGGGRRDYSIADLPSPLRNAAPPFEPPQALPLSSPFPPSPSVDFFLRDFHQCLSASLNRGISQLAYPWANLISKMKFSCCNPWWTLDRDTESPCEVTRLTAASESQASLSPCHTSQRRAPSRVGPA
ncbi:hypothetical protein CRG98_005605 [Punica granatum]|uniref:Uncharacterized protein n=1 Tax=Punica granatum TaxID=22663 RepID=A0A2I0KZT4_PUNGR|nr:hypothetical protein CRG98_005605 [Punica granatum]